MAEAKVGGLKNFIASVKTEGLMRTSRYAVTLSPPKAMKTPKDLRKILLFCSDVQIPGVTMSTTQIRMFGEIRESPYEKMFDNITMTFYVDNNMKVKQFFDDWISVIQNPSTRSFEYYKNYITNITLDVEDIKDRKRYEVKLFECYPKNVGSISVGYESKDIMKLQISMNYKYWTSTSFDAPKETKESPWDRYLKMPTINGRELESLPSVPSEWAENYLGFQKNFNNPLPENDTMVTGVTEYFGR
jgi:hypothetical protein